MPHGMQICDLCVPHLLSNSYPATSIALSISVMLSNRLFPINLISATIAAGCLLLGYGSPDWHDDGRGNSGSAGSQSNTLRMVSL